MTKKYLLLCLALLAGCAAPGTVKQESPDEWKPLAEQVKREYLRSWEGYKKRAMGSDELLSVSGEPRNWYKESLLITPIDALDGLLIMGFREEADSLIAYIASHCSWDKDFEVQLFEVNIRCLGGLLSSYEMTRDERLLGLAKDLGDRLLPAFNTSTGMPYRMVNLHTGAASGDLSNPAEVGTYILEFGKLSRLTGNPEYLEKARRASREIFLRKSELDLVGESIDVTNGQWRGTLSSIGGMIDSYYEYLLKGWRLTGEPELKDMWDTHLAALNRYLASETANGFWYQRVNMTNGKERMPLLGALDAFFPAMLAMSGDTLRARKMLDACFSMWNAHNLEPEMIDFSTMAIPHGSEAYHLRPEIVESCYYLYHYTGDLRYRRMAKKIFEDILRSCRTEFGFTEVKNVITKEQGNLMPSYFLGETLKYLYLIFSPPDTLPFDEVVFTTEAHPLRRQ